MSASLIDYQCVEWGTAEQRPPFAGDILHRDETPRCPGAPRHAGRGCGLPGQWLCCEVVAARRLGRMVVRVHGARRGTHQSLNHAHTPWHNQGDV